MILLASFLMVVACTKPAQKVTAFPKDARPLTKVGVNAAAGGWRVSRDQAESVPMFKVVEETCDACFLLYRAKVKTEDVTGRAYLEMWVQIPDKGEFFSKGFDQAISGTRDWTAMEIPFRLEAGQKADQVTLNLALDGGGGTAWIRDVELWMRPF